MIKRYYQEIHFKLNELILYYNLPVVTEENLPFDECPHMAKLRCSRAHELAPDLCITERKCELYLFRDTLFFEAGIDVVALNELDKKIRSKEI